MANVITKETLVPLGMIGGLLAVAFAVGQQNQKIEFVAAAVPVMQKDISDLQKSYNSLASQQEKNSVGVDTNGDGSTPQPLTSSPPWMSSVPKGWTIGPDGHLKEL